MTNNHTLQQAFTLLQLAKEKLDGEFFTESYTEMKERDWLLQRLEETAEDCLRLVKKITGEGV